MNFQYSYRALIITSLVTGILILFLFSLKLKSTKIKLAQETYEVELIPDEILPTENDLALNEPEKVEIETHQGYNEAEKYISAVENENQKITETTEGKLQEMEQALKDSENSANGNESWTNSKPEIKEEKKLSNNESRKEGKAIVKGGNRNTTISYNLKDRTDIALPNPVYICAGAGKVVINIEVNQLGRVSKTSYNKAASTTSNVCLIDAALEYSLQARFTTHPSRTTQLGTITFNFPGQ